MEIKQRSIDNSTFQNYILSKENFKLNIYSRLHRAEVPFQRYMAPDQKSQKRTLKGFKKGKLLKKGLKKGNKY